MVEGKDSFGLPMHSERTDPSWDGHPKATTCEPRHDYRKRNRGLKLAGIIDEEAFNFAPLLRNSRRLKGCHIDEYVKLINNEEFENYQVGQRKLNMVIGPSFHIKLSEQGLNRNAYNANDFFKDRRFRRANNITYGKDGIEGVVKEDINIFNLFEN